jgi:small subunit ribosomal protein S10
LKSVHIYKKHRVQYETRTYFSFIQYKYLTGSTADTLLEYVERNLPEGVALKATKVELQALPEHLTSP